MDADKEDLRATAEDMIEDSRRLEQLEREKLSLDADDPRYGALAHEIEQLVASMARKAQAQAQIAAEATD